MDPFDQAQEIEQLMRDKAISYQRSKTSDEASFKFCEDCGSAIPEKRRLAIQGVKTCIDCQTFNEEKRKLYGSR